MKTNAQLFSEAKSYISGGVNSPVRDFGAVGGAPVFIEKGQGSKLYSAEGREYLDYCLSWGALILGHAYPEVISEVEKALVKGTSFGAPTEQETKLAREICRAIPTIELVRLVNSGTEATMSALRLARGYTGRKKIIKFSGAYHGHADYLLAKAGSGLMTQEGQAAPSSQGIPEEFIAQTLVLPYNDLAAVARAVKEHAPEIAAIIVEPVAANMGVIPPEEGFLEGLREICNQERIVLIFDEVITGFRLAYGGAQEFFGIPADLTCLGKIIGGGFPLAAYGGKKEIMERVAPLGDVYQAGTLSGNPVATTAGLTTLKLLFRQKEKIYSCLEEKAAYLQREIAKEVKLRNLSVQVNRVGSLLSLFFTANPVKDYQSAKTTDIKMYSKFFQGMLAEGIYLPPSNFEAYFLSTVHSEEEIKRTLQLALKTLNRIN